MSLGPYESFIVTSYLLVTLVVAILIAWILIDYRNQKRRLRELEESGVVRRSGRSASEIQGVNEPLIGPPAP
jgi:heme exporter protein CcmD